MICLSFDLIGLYSKRAKNVDMLFESTNRGKVIITVELEDGKLTSHIHRKGITKNDKYALASVLGTYISMCREAEKDPKKLLDDNLEQLEEIIAQQREK
ncbi:MAG: hypothetical protein KFF73_15025 [Cyclobacteriaceae bacterium]|nr:hypothetical protein [Cyclobacteriaceae bacterium]